ASVILRHRAGRGLQPSPKIVHRFRGIRPMPACLPKWNAIAAAPSEMRAEEDGIALDCSNRLLHRHRIVDTRIVRADAQALLEGHVTCLKVRWAVIASRK